MMYYNIDNTNQSTASTSSLGSNASSTTPLCQLHDTLQYQTSSTFHSPFIPLPVHNPGLLSQYQYHHPYRCQSQPQTLSQDEWDLILSLRMMKNLSVLPPSQLPTSAVSRQAGDTVLHELHASHETGYQMQRSTCHTTEVPLIHPNTVPTATPQAQQTRCSTTQIQQLLTTVAASPPPISVQSGLEQTSLSSTTSVSPQIESGHQNYSSGSQLHSSPPTSPGAAIISSAQQKHHHQQKSPTQSSAASLRRHQSTHPQSPIFCYNATISGSTIELLDPTKPYKIGDAIKVGRRVLQSDISSLKYWVEDGLTITETTNGGHILNMAGYSYFVKNRGKSFVTWECTYRRSYHCSSIAIRSSDPTVKNYFRIYSIQGEHIHEPSSENVEVRKFKQRVRERCRQELSTPRTIYEDELKRGKFSPQMLAILPTFYNMQAQLYRIRQEHLPTSPTNSNFILHPAFTTTDRGERFLLYDSNAVQAPYTSAPIEVGRLLIYTSDLQLNILSKSERIGSDGTFETAAEISQQNYIIMGESEDGHFVPLVFCLCERKNYETYELIIRVLKIAVTNLKSDFKPTYWMSDYENGLVKAIKLELPNTQLLGCAFHYNQAVYRNIQSKGLQEAYQNLEAVRQILRQIMALAFLPDDQIRTAYDDFIVPQLSNVPARPTSLRHNLRNFFKYYESTWLTKIDQFCVFNQPTRTNNGLEGYNNKMNGQLSAHPHLYRLIIWFEKEELLVQQLVMKIDSNVPVHKRKRAPTTILIDESLLSLWDGYSDGTVSLQELLLESSKWIAKKV